MLKLAYFEDRYLLKKKNPHRCVYIAEIELLIVSYHPDRVVWNSLLEKSRKASHLYNKSF